MKFNEKLMNLRKKEGLSQEELAEKLNVTRQTISKWELGQTSPDMEKLSEIANIFYTSVDDLLSEKEIKNEPITNVQEEKQSKRKGTIIVILIIVLVCALVIGGYLFFTKIFGSIFGLAFDTINQTKEHSDELLDSNIVNDFWEGYNKQQEIINQAQENFERNEQIHDYNGSLATLYTGIKVKFFVEHAINQVIKTNQTYDKKITVKYNEIATQDINEIAKLSASLQDEQYLLTYDYDEEGYICTMNISDI